MSLRDRLYGAYWKLEQRVVPGLRNSQMAYEEALFEATDEGVEEWLDLGCGHRLLPEWRSAQEASLLGRATHVVGVDVDLPSLKTHRTIRRLVNGDVGRLPFADGSFDLVTCNMVMEHLDEPAFQLREIRRVLKPGGRLLFHTPNAHGYAVVLARVLPAFARAGLIRWLEGRAEADVFPTYYRCNDAQAIKRLADEAGFVPTFIRYVSSNAHFAVVLPLALIELLYVRLTRAARFEHLRSNLVVSLIRAD